MIFVESIRPILFTCIDENKQLYICSCCYASGNKCIWLVAKTNQTNVTSLLRNECEIRDMFETANHITIITKSDHLEIQSLTIKDIPQEFLPTKGYSLEIEESEFQ